MTTIALRPEAVGMIDVLPGDGLRDVVLEQLSALTEQVNAIGDDDASAIVRPAAAAAVLGAAQTRRFIWRLRDKQLSLMNKSATQAMFKRALQAAGDSIDPHGWGSHTAYAARQGAERARVTEQFATDMATTAIGEMAAKGQELVQGWVDALTGLSTAIDRASTTCEGPAALRSDITITDLQKMATLETEIAAWDEPMQRALVEFQRLARHDMQDRLRLFIPAARRAAVTIIQTPQPKLHAKRVARHDRDYLETDGDTPHTQARILLKALEAYEKQALPPSIDAADGVLARLKPVFYQLVGVHADFMTTAERSRGYYVSSSGQEREKEWPVDGEWMTRYLDPSPFTLPGHSRIAMFTDGKVPVRMGAPVPLVGAAVKNLGGE